MRPVDDPHQYQVVRNAQEQYAIWPAGHALPDGWSTEGTSGSQQECLRRIDSVWPDIRPLATRTLSGKPTRTGRGVRS